MRDGRPSSAEADRLLSRAAKLQASIAGHQAPASAGAWTGISSRLQGIASAYGMTWQGGR